MPVPLGLPPWRERKPAAALKIGRGRCHRSATAPPPSGACGIIHMPKSKDAAAGKPANQVKARTGNVERGRSQRGGNCRRTLYQQAGCLLAGHRAVVASCGGFNRNSCRRLTKPRNSFKFFGAGKYRGLAVAVMSFEGLRTNNQAICRRIAFAIISLLIFLPPAIPIVFGNKVHWIKGWQMYHDAGLGLLKGGNSRSIGARSSSKGCLRFR